MTSSSEYYLKMESHTNPQDFPRKKSQFNAFNAFNHFCQKNLLQVQAETKINMNENTDMNIDVDMSNILWKRNKFIQDQQSFINQQQQKQKQYQNLNKQDELNLSIDQDFMNQHNDVLINSFNDYMFYASKTCNIKIQLSAQERIRQKKKFQSDYDAINFISQNQLLTNYQKTKIRQEIKYDKSLYKISDFISSTLIISSRFKDQFSLIVIIFFNYIEKYMKFDEEIDDQKDLEEFVQKNLDKIVEQVLDDQRIKNIFFLSQGETVYHNKRELLTQFSILIQKWFFTFLSIKYDFFSNKYYKRKRMQSEKKGQLSFEDLYTNKQNKKIIQEDEVCQSKPTKKTFKNLRF